MARPPETILIARRFRGPLTSANGYAAGMLAGHVAAPAVEVTLRLPPPLERPLDVRLDGGHAVLLDGDEIVAEAEPSVLDLDGPRVSLEEAKAASGGTSGWATRCSGSASRAASARRATASRSMRARSRGRDGVHAATWQANEVSLPVVWAAIDCVARMRWAHPDAEMPCSAA